MIVQAEMFPLSTSFVVVVDSPFHVDRLPDIEPKLTDWVLFDPKNMQVYPGICHSRSVLSKLLNTNKSISPLKQPDEAPATYFVK